ncbi:MAG TPA: ABC transporter permease [Terriglobales bacterium]|nr:ABC transporter permease [Terriglobales bacterium]
MSATAPVLTNLVSRGGQPNLVRIFAKEAKYEFLKSIRLPVFAVSTILLPIMFYVLFGLLLNNKSGDFPITTFLIATYGTFGVMGAALFGFGVGMTVERGQGWLELKRASPMPPYAYFAAKVSTSMIFGAIISLSLLLIGIVFGGVHLAAWQMVKMVSVLVFGCVPFCALGLAIGYFAKPNSAPAMVNLIYLPLSFCSGLWVPVQFLPKTLQHFATYLPPYHLSQLALNVVGIGQGGSQWWHVRALIGATLLFLGIARIGYSRDQGKLYG